MANTGYKRAGWSAMQKGAADWTSDALANGAEETGDALSLDQKAACEIGIDLYEDNTGAISGNVTIYVLGTADGTNYEESAHVPSISFEVTPVQNDHVYFRFGDIDPKSFSSIKISVDNNSGQELAVTVKYNLGDVPAAS